MSFIIVTRRRYNFGDDPMFVEEIDWFDNKEDAMKEAQKYPKTNIDNDFCFVGVFQELKEVNDNE